MKKLNIEFLDSRTETLLKESSAKVHSIFTNNINILAEDTLITISNQVSKQRHIIKIKECIDFTNMPVSIGDSVILSNKQICLNNEVCFAYEDEACSIIDPFLQTYQLRKEHLHLLDNLKEWMLKQKKVHLDNYPKEDILMRYQFDKIDTFLKNKDIKSAKNLIGLGLGLTPIGDDILFGFILAKQAIDEHTFDFSALIKSVEEKTNILSIQLLKDLVHKDYSLYYREALEEFFIQIDIAKLKDLVHFGETSGMAILTGFLYGLTKRSEQNNDPT